MSDNKIRAAVLGFEDLEQDLLNEFERECNLTVTKWITFEPWESEINRCTQIHQLNYQIPKDDTFLAIYDSIYTNIF